RRFGHGSPLLLVHGFPLSRFTWRKGLPELSRRHTCWGPGLPGLGGAGWADAPDFRFPGQGPKLKAAADRPGLERHHVLAQDTGGIFARYLALADGARVGKLILINTEVPHHRPPWIPLYQQLIALPGSVAFFNMLLRLGPFVRSGMGFGGCFTDLRLLDGDFHDHVIQPLIDSPRRMEGNARYLGGLTWGPVDAPGPE